MGATAVQPKNAKRRRDRAKRRGYHARPEHLRVLGDPRSTPIWPWMAEGVPRVPTVALAVRARRERIAAGVLDPDTGKPYQTIFDVRQYRTLLCELSLLCRIACSRGNRTGGTLVTTTFQLYELLRGAHPAWTPAGDQDKDRDTYWSHIAERLYTLEAMGLLSYYQDGHEDEWPGTWITRRLILQFHDLPDVSDEELSEAAKILKARERRHGKSLTTSSTMHVPNVYEFCAPLSRSEIQRRGVAHTKAAKAARAAHGSARTPSPSPPPADLGSPVVTGSNTDRSHPFGTLTEFANTTVSSIAHRKPSGFSYARDARETASHATANAAPETSAAGRFAFEEPRVGTMRQGDADSLAESASAARREAGRSNIGGCGSQTRSGRYSASLAAWLAGDHSTPIPHPGQPPIGAPDDAAWQARFQAYLPVARRYPEATREALRHDERVAEIHAAAAGVLVRENPCAEATRLVRYAWTVARHQHYVWGDEKASAQSAAGNYTQADRGKWQRAIDLYNRYSDHRPPGWPAQGADAVWHIGQLAHDEQLPAFRFGFQRPQCRWLADGIERLMQEARDMKARAKLFDGHREARLVKRAQRRAEQGDRTQTGELHYRVAPIPTGLEPHAANYWRLGLDPAGEPLPRVAGRDEYLLGKATRRYRTETADALGWNDDQLLPARFDGAQARLRRREAALDPYTPVEQRQRVVPAWTRHPFKPVRIVVDGNPLLATWISEPTDVSPERLELAHYIGRGSLPRVLTYTDDRVRENLEWRRGARADTQTSTNAYTLTHGNPAGKPTTRPDGKTLGNTDGR